MNKVFYGIIYTYHGLHCVCRGLKYACCKILVQKRNSSFWNFSLRFYVKFNGENTLFAKIAQKMVLFLQQLFYFFLREGPNPKMEFVYFFALIPKSNFYNFLWLHLPHWCFTQLEFNFKVFYKLFWILYGNLGKP